MKSLDQMLGDLLRENAEVKKMEAAKPPVVLNLPDALVLVVFTLECEGCEARFEYPNAKVLVRKGKNITPVKEWLQEYNNVPREVVTRHSKVPSCQYCFEEILFGFGGAHRD